MIVNHLRNSEQDSGQVFSSGVQLALANWLAPGLQTGRFEMMTSI
jgi:hypothetical protein